MLKYLILEPNLKRKKKQLPRKKRLHQRPRLQHLLLKVKKLPKRRRLPLKRKRKKLRLLLPRVMPPPSVSLTNT